MIPLFRKDFIRLIPIYAATMLMFALFFIVETDYASESDSFMQFTTLFSLAAIFSSIIHIEKYEDKNNGFAVLKNLPVKWESIVNYKYIFIYVFILMHTGLSFIVFKMIYGSQFTGIYIYHSVVIGCISILSISFLYYLVFRYGYSRFHIPVLLYYLSILVLNIVLLSNENLFDRYASFLNNGYYLYLVLITLGFSFFIMKILKRKKLVRGEIC